MNATGPLSFDAIINDVNYRSTLDQMERRMLGFTSSTVRETGKLDANFRLLSQAAAGYFSFQALAELPAQILKVRGEFQQLEIAFTTMLRSKSKQEKLLGELVQTAATTPFNLRDIATGAKQLLAYGSSTSTVVKEIRMLGDVASGVSVPIQDLIYLYGTLRTQGRAYAVDIRQFAGRGIPIYQELSKVLGVSVDKVNDFVSAGKVGFKEVEQAFKNMTSSGGLFAGLMDAQSKSLLGLKERLADAWDLMLNEIGKKNQDVAGALLTTAIDVVEHYQDFIDILEIATATYGAYKAAVLIASIAQSGNIAITAAQAIAQAQAANAGGFLTLSQTRAAAATSLLSRAQASLNAVMAVNPYVLVATAIAALATAYFVLKEDAIQAKTAQELLAETSKDVNAKFGVQKAEIVSLVSVIKNQNVAESERLKAYEKLKEISPSILDGLDFQKAKTVDLTKALDEYLTSLKKKIKLESGQDAFSKAFKQELAAADQRKKAQDEVIKATAEANKKQKEQEKGINPDGSSFATGAASILKLQQAKANLEEAVKFENKAKAVTAEVEKSIGVIATEGSKEDLRAKIAREELTLGSVGKLTLAYKNAEENLAKYRKELERLTDAEKKGQVVKAKTIDDLDAEIKKLKEDQNKVSSRADFDAVQKKIEALEKQRRRLTGELTQAEKKAAKEADKTGPLGSVAYYEAISKKAKEILEKTPSTNKAEIARQSAIKLDADRKAEEGRKLFAVKTFDEELEDKKGKYELYQKWVLAYSKEAADKQFSELLTGGKSYVDYLDQQIALLEAKKGKGNLSEKEVKNLSLANSERDELLGKKSAIDLFKEGLQKAADEAINLTDYLDILQQKQAELNPKDNSPTGIAKRQILGEQIAGTQRDIKEQLAQYVQSAAGSEGQFLAIQKKFADLRTGVEKKFNGNRTAEYKKALNQIDSDEKEALFTFQEDKLKQTEAYKNLTKVIDAEGRKRLKIEIANQRAVVDEAKNLYGPNSEIVKKQEEILKGLTKQDSNGFLYLINQYGTFVGELGDALSEIGGVAGQAGRALAGMASNLKTLSLAMKEGATDAEKMQAGFEATISIVNILVSSANQRKQAESDYYRSVIAQQQEYNLLLNEQIGLRAKSNENIFVKDYEGELKDSFAKYNDADKKYQESLKKLNEGRVKTGQRNAVDAANIGKAAAAGAALGTVVIPIPVIGTLIGAGVGALVGLFGGKKKKDEFGSLLAEYPELIQKSKDGVNELNVSLAQTLISSGLVDDKTKDLLQSTIDWQKQMEEAKAAIKEIAQELAGALGNKLRDSLVGAFEEGTDSAVAFGKAVEDILEDIISKLLFSKIFGQAFEDLGKDIEKSLNVSAGGDGTLVDDFGRFYAQRNELNKQYEDALKAAQEQGKAFGLNLFQPTGAGVKGQNPNSLSGAVKGIQEETASVLVGQLNAIRINQAETGTAIRQQLLVLSGIEKNTGDSSKYLEEIVSQVSRITGGLRAKGIL